MAEDLADLGEAFGRAGYADGDAMAKSLSEEEQKNLFDDLSDDPETRKRQLDEWVADMTDNGRFSQEEATANSKAGANTEQQTQQEEDIKNADAKGGPQDAATQSEEVLADAPNGPAFSNEVDRQITNPQDLELLKNKMDKQDPFYKRMAKKAGAWLADPSNYAWKVAGITAVGLIFWSAVTGIEDLGRIRTDHGDPSKFAMFEKGYEAGSKAAVGGLNGMGGAFESDSGGLSTGAIVGIAIGGAAFVIILITVFVVGSKKGWFKKK